MLTDDNKIEKKKQFINIFHNPFTAWVILGISLTLTVAAYHISSNFVKQGAQDRFEFRAGEIQKAIEERLRIYEQQLWSGVGLMYSSEQTDRAAFAKFVETMDIDSNWPGIQGVGFSVPVKPENKQFHINAIRAEGFPGFTIRPEGERKMYSSIIYLEPFDWRNKRAFGYDMWSNEMRRAAMKRARDHGVAATSGIITLVQETKDDVQRGFLTYVPVYKTKNIPKTIEERRMQFMGWVYAPFRAGDLMKGIIGTKDPSIEFEVFDGELMNTEALLFDSNSSLHLNEIDHHPDLENTTRLTNQGREWTLYLNTPKNYLTGSEQNQPRFIAAAGAIVDLLLFYVIWSLYFINKRAESIAREMTVEIENAKLKLEDTVKERTRELQQARDHLEDQVTERTERLERSNNDLEILLYVVTHDLKEPLRSIEYFSSKIGEKYGDKLDKKGKDYVRRAINSTERMRILLDEILTMSRARKIGESSEIIDFCSAAKDAIVRLESIIKESGATIKVDNDLPKIKADKLWVTQAIYNLTANAIKFNSDNSPPEVEIVTYEPSEQNKGQVGIVVRDRGPGVEEEYRERIFQLFQRAVDRDVEGTGAGLAIVREIATRHGGNVWVESRYGGGSDFILTFKS